MSFTLPNVQQVPNPAVKKPASSASLQLMTSRLTLMGMYYDVVCQEVFLSQEINRSKMFEEALKYTDPNVLKTARAAVRGEIASAVTSTNILAKDATTEDFDHSLISRNNALSVHDNLVANLEWSQSSMSYIVSTGREGKTRLLKRNSSLKTRSISPN